MKPANDEWRVLPHQPIEKLSENVWRVLGDIPGMSLKRVMVIAKRADGQLVFHSPIALNDAAMAEVEAWGKPGFIVVPSGIHRLDAPRYKKRYSSIKVFAPSGSRSKVQELLAVDGTYAEFPPDAAVRLEAVAGLGDQEGAMWVRSNDGQTLVLNDCVFNMDTKTDFLGWLFTTVFGSAPGPRVSRLAKMTLVKDKPAFKADLLRFAEGPDLVRLIVAHEKVASGPDAKAALRQAATYL
ncbi:MAG TPA: hypothetical protein VHO25_06765 [Polyangiaceae bacterium]|nr:hypothetical protein [Polyangiaceae bacterium]